MESINLHHKQTGVDHDRQKEALLPFILMQMLRLLPCITSLLYNQSDTEHVPFSNDNCNDKHGCSLYVETVKIPPTMAHTDVRNCRKLAFFSAYSTIIG